MCEPLISVIIPVYNSENHLHRCLDSIVNQTYGNLQIILIDDGSTDDSGRICDDYAAKDDRIQVIHQQNGGVSRARNQGLKVAVGDYYSFPDSDDYMEEDSYEYLIGLIKKHNCDAVNFEYYITYSDYEKKHLLNDDSYGLKNTEEAHKIIVEGEPFCCNKLYSKQLITAVEHFPELSFREDIYRGEDSLFAHEAIDRSVRVWFDRRPLYHYVQSEESACRGRFRKTQLTGLRLFEEYRNMFQERYPEVWKAFLRNVLHLPVTLYYDMYSDELSYKEEMKKLHCVYKRQYREVMQTVSVGKKEKIKFGMFYHIPNVFCKVHKVIHRL